MGVLNETVTDGLDARARATTDATSPEIDTVVAPNTIADPIDVGRPVYR